MSKCKLIRDNLFYIMVDLNDVNTPQYRIIPSKVVLKQTEERHKEFIKTHPNANDMREFFDNENKYINNWKILINFCKERG